MNLARKIEHINMVVPNLQKSIDWYCNKFGFTVKGHFESGGFEIYYIDNGSVTYEMFENPSLTEPIVDHIAYISDDIEADHKLYSDAGLRPSGISHIPWIWEQGADYFFISGPAGEKIELIHIR